MIHNPVRGDNVCMKSNMTVTAILNVVIYMPFLRRFLTYGVILTKLV